MCWNSWLSVTTETWRGLVGGDWRCQVQQPYLHQEADPAAEGQGECPLAQHSFWDRQAGALFLCPAHPDSCLLSLGEAWLCGPGHWCPQLHSVLHEWRLHGMWPGIQIQCGRERSWDRQRLRLSAEAFAFAYSWTLYRWTGSQLWRPGLLAGRTGRQRRCRPSPPPVSLLLPCHSDFGSSVCRCRVAVTHKLYSIFMHVLGFDNRIRHS